MSGTRHQLDDRNVREKNIMITGDPIADCFSCWHRGYKKYKNFTEVICNKNKSIIEGKMCKSFEDECPQVDNILQQ